MIKIPALRWGKPYESLETQKVVHFETGEKLAEVSVANAGIVERDMRKAGKAREALRKIPSGELIEIVKTAARLYMEEDLPLGDGVQSPDDFVRYQSATTGLPEHMCRFNMEKNRFVLENMDQVLDSLTRGLDLDILAKGHGIEERGVPLSFQAQSPVLGLVLPSNSPGVHTLWMPVIPLQVGLVFKPGPQEPWTPYRMTEAFFQAGIPREAISIYPGEGDVGAAVLASCPRSLIFGGQATIDRYRADPKVQAHGPGYSKILIGDDCVDDWEKYIDILVDSVLLNSGRGCINASGIWASRHTREIAEAMSRRMVEVKPLPSQHPDSALAAFTVPGVAEAVSNMIDQHTKDPKTEDVTGRLRDGERFESHERCDYLLPTVLHCESPEADGAKAEYMFPFATVVECPQDQMLKKMGETLVCSAITGDENFRSQLIDATHIDRLNLGPVPTIKLNWLQPHEGNLIDFLFRNRAFQQADL